MLTKAEIKIIRSLGDKASRYEQGLFVAEGEKLVAEAEKSGFTVREVYRVGENVTAGEMERISFLKTPTPVLAVIEIPYYSKSFGNRAYRFEHLTLALDGVQDPGNLGTIIRVADWFGVRNVYCSPETVDCWSPKVVQATMGAIFRVRVHYRLLASPQLGQPAGEEMGVLNVALTNGVPVYGTFLEGDSIYGADGLEADRGVIVMGNEGKGISAEIGDLVSRKLFIPSFGEGDGSESLNVAMATGIVLSEFRRRG